jgi:hypothetical protein
MVREAAIVLLAMASIECGVRLVVLPLTEDLAQERFYAPDRVPTLAESVVQWQIHHASRIEEPQDLMVVGDSSGLMGVRPEGLMQEVGGRSWNLCTIGFVGISGQVRALRHYLARHAPPGIVVFHCSIFSLTTTEDGLRETSASFERFGAWMDRLEGERSWLASLELRPRIRRLASGWMAAELLRQPRGPYGSDEEVRAELWRRRGALTEVVRDPWKRSIDVEGTLSPIGREAIAELFELARERRMRVLVVLAPIPDRADTPVTRATLAGLERELRELSAGGPGVETGVPFVRWYPVELCARMHHVTEQGAERNTREIARMLRDLGWDDLGGGAVAGAPD